MAEQDGGDAGPGKKSAEDAVKPGESEPNVANSVGNFGGAGPGLTQGFEIAVGVGLGAVVGMWCDRHLHSSPWGLLIGLLIGCVAGTYLLIKETMRSNRN